MSAHWEEAPLALGATSTVPLVYDFRGFDQHNYEVTYATPGAPALADSVRKLLRGAGKPVKDFPDRGLDHGAYVPLVEMFPDADVPVLQISIPSLRPEQLMAIGRTLAPLRDEGVLITGSGFFTHNLSAIDALLDFEHKAPGARLAHPRTEHFAPLFVTLGAAQEDLAAQRMVIDGFWGGLSKRSVQFA